MMAPCLAFVLAVRGEVSWRRGDWVEDRLWLVRLPNPFGRDETRGLGYSSARVMSSQAAVDGRVCVRTRVFFLMWEGTGQNENADFCECYLRGPSGEYEAIGVCP
jgi:hypothetical protein